MTKELYRIIFMGTPEFAVPALRGLLDHGENVVGVVTQPDRPKGRGRRLTPPPVKLLAQEAGVPVIQPEKIRTKEFLDQIREFAPDLITVAAYGRILPGALLFLPPLGSINVHASLLPNYRGAAPIQWAIINGEKETGVTIMQMDEGLDTGDILLPGSIPIEEDDTTGSLAVKLSNLGGKLLVQALDLMRAGTLVPQKQDDSGATLAPPLSKEQGRIDWHQPASAISCLIRGMDPWPSAYTILGGKRYKLFSPLIIKEQAPESPGNVIKADAQGLVVATGEGYLRVLELQKEGARRMTVADYLRGHELPSQGTFE